LRDHQDREAKKIGTVEQGPKVVTPEEFNQIHNGDGIGLDVRSKADGRLIHIRIPKSYEPQSIVVLGDTRPGKTVALKQMIDQIEKRGDLAVIHDPSRLSSELLQFETRRCRIESIRSSKPILDTG